MVIDEICVKFLLRAGKNNNATLSKVSGKPAEASTPKLKQQKSVNKQGLNVNKSQISSGSKRLTAEKPMLTVYGYI